MSSLSILFFTLCLLAYANGANDNFKGVASLFESAFSPPWQPDSSSC
ncbi:MAG: hypothetical protein HY736_20345 [Verrucomicrobia bacterium]|nr:hypothetical protein [Verrucomicrobiota bacterium]